MFQEKCRVTSIIQRSTALWEVSLLSPAISAASRPGHFVNLLPSDDWSPPMRRPMSIAAVSGDIFRIIFKIVGSGTEKMRSWKPGHLVDCIGPLGNTWTDYDAYFPLLVGGGVGIAPIQFLHEDLTAGRIRHSLIAGALTSGEHLFKHDPDSGVWLTTDDGSCGISGNVIMGLKKAIAKIPEKSEALKIFCCGPPAMNRAVGEFALQAGIRCDISVETVMACGTGICQGCAIELQQIASELPIYRQHFALACKDGPIFRAELLF
ncbi:MAG: hypothetical protein GXO91_04700 [FCB group bacterium]|nr:hypothetical protein [FCB group bacterium]